MMGDTIEKQKKFLKLLEEANFDGKSKREIQNIINETMIIAGYSEKTVKNARKRIWTNIGMERINLALFKAKTGNSKPQQKQKKNKTKIDCQSFIPKEEICFGNEKIIDLLKIPPRTSAYLSHLPYSSSKKDAMIRAGFSESMAKNPQVIEKTLAGLGAKTIINSLQYFGVDSIKIGEILSHFLNRTEFVDMIDTDGKAIKKEQYNGASVNMALTHIQKFMQMLPQEKGNDTDAEPMEEQKMEALKKLFL